MYPFLLLLACGSESEIQTKQSKNHPDNGISSSAEATENESENTEELEESEEGEQEDIEEED